ncbi:glycosyltransferase family 4 protein [Cloacibacterium sp.]|uniref:glycosyltransferase family 4 protein n=1 Tax=Cloacibacterium sp. TaxID=1913682 RepID=UPI0039E4E2F0
MKINYFHRNKALGFSIQKVFRIVIDELKKKNEITEFYTPTLNSMPWDILKNSFYVFKNKKKGEIHHITGHIHDSILGLIGCKSVLTIHDLVFLDHVKNPIKKFYKWLFWLYLPIKIAKKVTCISEHTKKNILKYLPTDKLTVIYNAVDPKYQFSPKEFNVEKPVILHIGTGWNKNLERTIEALHGINCHLRIVGKIKQEMIDKLLFYNIDYSQTEGINDEEIIKEYCNCDIINFPSEYEGFGMPIIEGQAIGRIVLTSNIDPMTEVGLDTVYYVNPFDINSMHEGYLSIISQPELREKLIKKGLENIKRFGVDKIAQDYINLYQSIL